MNVYLVEKVLEIKSKGGNWKDLIFGENSELDCFNYDLLLTELNLSNEFDESTIDENIQNFFDSIYLVGDKND